MTSEYLTQLGPIALKALASIIITGLLGVIVWPVRKAKKEWIALKTNLQETHKELVQQRTNCLTTLQLQGETQIELLGKTVAALDGVRLDLREQMGILRVPPRARVARRKK